MVWLRRHAGDTLAAVYGLATAVILAGNIDRSFDFDESVSIASTISRGSARVALTETAVFSNHPIFAAGQSVWWALGGDSEARQRLLPVLYGAVAVTVLVVWASRRLGLLAGACAGAVLMLNPMFVTQSRLVRGYSLATLGVVIGTVTLVDYVYREQTHERSASPWLLVAHALAVVVALGTHLFAGVALGAVGIGALIILRRVDLRLWGTWVVVAAGVVAVYLPTFDELRQTAEERGRDFKPWFARVTSWEVLGRDRVTALVVAAIAVAGIGVLVTRQLTKRRDVGVAAVVVPLLVAVQGWVVWQVWKPFDLYPRFFLAVVPLVALAVAIGVRRLPWLAAVLAVGMLFTVGNVVDARSTSTPIREAAAVVHTADDAGLRSCVVGGRPLHAYGAAAAELNAGADDGVAELAGCDVFVRIGGWGRSLLEPARAVFAHESRVGGFEVFSTVAPAELGL